MLFDRGQRALMIAFDDKLDLVPVLATSWKRTNDTTWEFDLRKDVKFSDGTPLTANDVVVSFERALFSSGFDTEWM